METRKKSILVVDDDESILNSLKEILEFEAYDVDTAGTGKEALEKSEKQLYNLALLDIKLPDIEGTKLLKMMHRSNPKMMKIMVTGYPTLDNAVEALRMGADEYLMKPINPEAMLKVVKNKLREQADAEKMDELKVKKWIETRVRKLKQS